MAGVEEHRRQAEQNHIEEQQERCQINVKEDLEHGEQQEQAHAEADCPDQQGSVHHGAHLLRQHREIRLRNGDQHAHHKTDGQQDTQLARPRQALADMLAHRGHRQVRPHVEEADADYQQDRGNRKDAQFFRRDVHPGRDREQENQRRDRNHRNQRLPQFLTQRLSDIRQDVVSFVHICTKIAKKRKDRPDGAVFPKRR